MPKPKLTGVNIAKLPPHDQGKKEAGTITASDIGTGDTVEIVNGDKKKKWQGPVTTETSTAGTWNFTVTCTKYKDDPLTGPETIAVTVSNSSGASNSMNTTSDVP